MEIKRSSFTRPEFPEVTSVNEANKSQGRFERERKTAQLNALSASVALPGVRAVYELKDLQMPARRNSAVQHALDELIHAEFPAISALPASQRSYLVEWMAKDPIIQSRMVNYLQRALE